MNNYKKYYTGILALIFSVALLFAGCKNPAGNGDENHGHSIPYSIEFVQNGETVVSYSDGNTEGHFDVEEGQETVLITVEFLDEEDHEIHAEDLDDEYSPEWEVGDTSIAGIEQHENEGRWSFHIVGKAAGETSVQFKLMHINHEVFQTPSVDRSNAIPVHVQEPNQ